MDPEKSVEETAVTEGSAIIAPKVEKEPEAIRSKIGKQLESFFAGDSGQVEKIEAGLKAMHQALTEEKIPQFRSFWEARRLTSALLATMEDGPAKDILLEEINNLTRDEKNLKEHIQGATSSFVKEMVAKIIEMEAKVKTAVSEESPVDLSFIENSTLFNKELYAPLQRPLSFYDACAKELDIIKNQIEERDLLPKDRRRLFDKITLVESLFYPIAKELTGQISKLFNEDLKRFESTYFEEDKPKGKFLDIEKEIKVLRLASKKLLISHKSFAKTSKILTDLWEKVQKSKGEWREESEEKKQQRKLLIEKAQEKIRAKIKFLALKAADPKSDEAIIEKLKKDFSQAMQEIDLPRKESEELWTEAKSALAPFVERALNAANAEKRKIEQREQKGREAFNSVQKDLERIATGSTDFDLLLEKAFKKIENLPIGDVEKVSWVFRLLESEFEGLNILESKADTLELQDKILTQRENQVEHIEKLLERARKLSKQKVIFGIAQILAFQEALQKKEALKKLVDKAFDASEDKYQKLKKGG